MYEHEKEAIKRIRQRFPEEAKRTDQWHIDRGWEECELEDAPHRWLEAFADRTTEAARICNWSAVTAHTDFIGAEYSNGVGPIKELVDVAYAENLMWDLDDSSKVVAWPHIAKVVQDLYVRMWGPPKPAGVVEP